MQTLARLFSFIMEVYWEWINDRVNRLAAAISFYAMFSLAPVLVVAIAIAGFIMGAELVSEQIFAELSDLFSAEGAAALRVFVDNTMQTTSGIIATVISLLAILFGASAFFWQIQGALNTLWGVELDPGSPVQHVILNRLLGLAIAVGVGIFILVTLAASTIFSAFVTPLADESPVGGDLIRLLEAVFSLASISIVFMLVYKVVPDVHLRWRDLILGSIFSASLFTIGKAVLALYLRTTSFSSAYGAAGSFVVLLVWVFFSAHILLLGMEFTKVFMRRRGLRVTLMRGVRPVGSGTVGRPGPSLLEFEESREGSV